MININQWMEQFLAAARELFGERLWFVGLQGSYGRGEATDTSDIDIVVILDTLNIDDLKAYSHMLDQLPARELICGFMSGKEELLCWEPSDLFQFYYDTTPVVGSLDSLLKVLDITAVKRAVKLGACNIYHSCVHNIVHEKSGEIVAALYKSAVFTLQAIGFLQTGHYERQKDRLMEILDQKDRKILENALHIKECGSLIMTEEELFLMSDDLLSWACEWIVSAEQRG